MLQAHRGSLLHMDAPPEKPADPAAFRAGASKAYRVVMIALALLVLGLVGLGWWIGGWIGLLIGLGIGLVVALIVGFGATFLFAMSQDGG